MWRCATSSMTGGGEPSQQRDGDLFAGTGQRVAQAGAPGHEVRARTGQAESEAHRL